MKRHSLILRAGVEDKSSIAIRDRNSTVTEIQLIESRKRVKFGIGQLLDLLAKRSLRPSNTAIDLAVVAAATVAADTRVSRAIDSQDSWTREIDLYIPVKDVNLWQDVSELLVKTLKFLTGDVWRIEFRKRNHEYLGKSLQSTRAAQDAYDSVSLLSGGLDSFVGAIDLLEKKRRPLYVSHYWDVSTSSQIECLKILAGHYGNLADGHVRARIGFPTNLIRNSGQENTTRGRSFLFFAMASLATSCFDTEMSAFVPENGLISLNVPLDPLRIGAWSTRTTHPFYVARWKELTQRLGLPVVWENPYRFKTKGEMIAECANRSLLHMNLAKTISCASIGKARWKGLSPQHCGHCVPCLIRRSAIKHALSEDPTAYVLKNLSKRKIILKSVAGQNIRSFQRMAMRLSSRPELSRILVLKSGPLIDYSDREIAEYSAVFARGIAEVGRLVEGAVIRP